MTSKHFCRSDMFAHLQPLDTAAINASDAAEEARRQGFEASLEARDVLKLTHELPAFRSHPSSGERVWHNHLAVLHSRSWADEFLHAAYVLRSARHAACALAFYLLDMASHALVGAEGLSQHVTHHGGSPIRSSHTWHVRRLIWRHSVLAPWVQGDLVLLDNARIAHARMPFSASGPRNLWVAWTTE